MKLFNLTFIALGTRIKTLICESLRIVGGRREEDAGDDDNDDDDDDDDRNEEATATERKKGEAERTADEDGENPSTVLDEEKSDERRKDTYKDADKFEFIPKLLENKAIEEIEAVAGRTRSEEEDRVDILGELLIEEKRLIEEAADGSETEDDERGKDDKDENIIEKLDKTITEEENQAFASALLDRLRSDENNEDGE